MRLSSDSLASVEAAAQLPRFDRAQATGIVHFGIGAFHRAHQAWYTDACLHAGEGGWMIAGVSMRSRSVAEQLNPQDGLYTLTERSAQGAQSRVIGAVRDVLVLESDREEIIGRIASAECRIVSFTVTEKGYCRAADGSLDHDRARDGFYPILAEAMGRRRAAGAAGLTLLSCDNLSGNGRQLRRLMGEWLAANNPECRNWFEDHCTTPDTMVDRIVPASTQADLTRLEARLGVRDEGAVFTEPFSQWVIADEFADGRPGWDRHGAQIVADVAPYETAKLRMLNGAHSLLAYAGLDAGHTFVHEAIADPALRGLCEELMLREAMPTIEAGEGQDLAQYARALLDRFANPALDHRLDQIAIDGSQKIPQRWLETLAAHGEASGDCHAILTGIAHWLRHIRGDVRPVEDPLAEELASLWRGCGAEGIVDALFGEEGLLASDWRVTQGQRAFIEARLAMQP